MKLRMLFAALFGVVLLLRPLQAADEPTTEKENPAHDELRALRKQLVEAANKGDIDALLPLLDKDVVVTWLNGEVSHKPDEVRAYLERMLKGPDHIVQKYETNPDVTELTHLYGDTGVAYGTSNDKYVLTSGQEFVMPTRWSATLVKKDGKWLIANFHASANVFDNPILGSAVRRTAIGVGSAAGLGGLFVGFILGRLIRRRPAT